MHAYRDQYARIFNDGQDVVLIAISADPIEELASWARDDQFQFLMASDADLEVGRLYGTTTWPVTYSVLELLGGLFTVTEGRLGVVVTFLAVMELIKESLVEIVQTEDFGPIHVKARAT